MISVVLLSTTPVAGSPWQIFQCLKKYAAETLSVRFISQRSSYNDGRRFPYDILLSDPSAKQLIKQADVLHFQNNLLPEALPYIDKKKQKVLATFHSVPRQGRWKELLQLCHQCYVIRQPAQMKEWSSLPTLPNMFDIWHYTPLEREWKTLTINYCPSNTMGKSHAGSKGYHEVLPILHRIEKEFPIKIQHFMGKPYLENLELKRKGHVCIDDIIHTTFHLTSIEAASFGQAIFTGIGQEEGFPFYKTSPEKFYGELVSFFRSSSRIEEFQDLCILSRQWAEQHWNPHNQIQDFIKAYTL